MTAFVLLWTLGTGHSVRKNKSRNSQRGLAATATTRAIVQVGLHSKVTFLTLSDIPFCVNRRASGRDTTNLKARRRQLAAPQVPRKRQLAPPQVVIISFGGKLA
jgi:hypothetical protein